MSELQIIYKEKHSAIINYNLDDLRIIYIDKGQFYPLYPRSYE